MLTSFSKTYLNATGSPLLLLPAEIRNMIFEYAMYYGTIDIYQKYNSRTGNFAIESRHAIPLLFVCRQIYSEVVILPFKLNVFSFRLCNYFDLSNSLERRKQEQLDLMMEVRCQRTSPSYAEVHVASAAIWIECFQKREKRAARNVVSPRRLARLISSLQQADTTVS